MTNEQIDLELFKVCYPELLRPVINFGQIRYTNEHGHECDLFRFTYDIEVCFSVLIPEMNRRGWFVDDIHQELENGTICGWNVDLYSVSSDCHCANGKDESISVAISKAAYAALNGEKC